MIFDWHASAVGKNAQTVGIQYNGSNYLLIASPTIKPNEYQAMCNSVRITKDLFDTVAEAKIACEKWFRREIMGESWDAETALADFISQQSVEIIMSAEELTTAILANFKVEPR